MTAYSMLELFRQEVEAQVHHLTHHLTQLKQSPPSPGDLQTVQRTLQTIDGLAQIVGVEAAAAQTRLLQTRLAELQQNNQLNAAEIDRLIQMAENLVAVDRLSKSDQQIELPQQQLVVPASPAVDAAAAPPPEPQVSGPQAERSDPPIQTSRQRSLLVDDQMIELFRLEVEEQTKVLNEGLIGLESQPAAPQLLEALMRAAHSIKGAARIVGLDAAVRLAHSLEDCFVAAQNQTLVLDQTRIDHLLRGVDLLQHLGQIHPTVLPDWLTQHEPEIAAVQSMIQAAQPASTAPPLTEKLPILQTAPSLTDPNGRETPSGANPVSAQRVVRVSADSLNHIMGLAGELLIEANALPTFANALKQVRLQQLALSAGLEALEQQIGSHLTLNSVDHNGFERVRQQEQTCRNQLSDCLTEFEELIRRTTHVSERLYQEVITSQMRPFEEGVQNFPRMVRDLARSLDKSVRLEILGRTTSVDRDILARLETPLTHILRNAVDHGIEAPADRLAAGKPAEGTIRLEAAHRGGMLTLEVTDDGAGIDRQQLRQALVSREIVTPEMATILSDAELLEFLFLPGFSLSTRLTELSGRGVGLDIVRSMVQEVGGTVRITSQPGKGTGFHFQLPLTLSVVRTLLVEVAAEVYAFPLSRIDQIIHLPSSDLFTAEGRPYFMLDQQPIGLISLSQVLDLPPLADTADTVWVVVLSDQSATYGLIVDRCLGEKELVLRPLDPRLGKVQDVSAAALLNDGSLALILDVSDLIQSLNKLLQSTQLTRTRSTQSRQHQNTKRVLVVDDSITVREMERRLLQNHGYWVDVAVDGIEGWNAVRSYPYDLVISDVDMPRMNGIELIKEMKQHSRLQTIPVIVVSYRDREDDRIQGLEAGANYYLTKNSFHDDTLIRAVTDLIGESVQSG